MSYIDNKKKNKKVVVIDELESLTSTTEKNFISSLIKNNELTWEYPIILISNNQHNKLLSDIKKNFIEIKLWQPYPQYMLTLLNRITKAEKIKLQSSSVANKIIEHSQLDFRRLVFVLQNIKYVYGNSIITDMTIDEYCRSSKKKDDDLDLFKTSEILLHKYTSIDSCIRYYETEKVLLPLMIHQNYISCATQFKKPDAGLYNNISKISDYLSKGDVIENYIYGDQNWDMQEVHGFYTCAATSYELTKLNPLTDSVKLIFPMDLNRSSIKSINRKNILNANKCLPNMNITDYIYINQIMKKMLAQNKIKECVDLFHGYEDIELEHIESLLKVDKIQSSKTNLALKVKKEFRTHINNMKISTINTPP